MSKNEYIRLLEKLIGLKMQVGFNEGAKEEYLQHLHKHFNEREISILKEGNAIPDSYRMSDYKSND